MSVERSVPRLAQLDVEGAGAAVARAGLGVAENDGAQVGLFQPMRNAASDDAALALAHQRAQAVGRLLAALAGDDQHRLVALGVGREQKGAQASARVALARSVQIDAGIDLYLAGGDLADLAAG